MEPLVFSKRIGKAMSWATDAPGGFAEGDVELFRDLVTAFVSVLEATAGRRIYAELLATYVGRDRRARIMAGPGTRGAAHTPEHPTLRDGPPGWRRPPATLTCVQQCHILP